MNNKKINILKFNCVYKDKTKVEFLTPKGNIGIRTYIIIEKIRIIDNEEIVNFPTKRIRIPYNKFWKNISKELKTNDEIEFTGNFYSFTKNNNEKHYGINWIQNVKILHKGI